MADSPQTPAETTSEPLRQRLERAAHAAWRALVERRGLRVALAGGGLLIVALVLGAGSALGLAIGIAGLVMLVVGSLGPRLRGRMSLEFGPAGTSFAVQTHIAPPGRALAAGEPEEDLGRAPTSLVPPPVEEADVVESSGETIEVELQQLRSMLAPQRDS